MVNYKEIIRLAAGGTSQRQIAVTTGNARNTVSEVLSAAKTHNISWPIDEAITNDQLAATLFPNRHDGVSMYLEPDFTYIHKELAKPKVTLTLLWEEYRHKAESMSLRPYMTTQFGDKYRSWARITKATMRIHHKPGDAMEVDWAGQTLPLYDKYTGESSPVYLFVAVLSCSGYTYAEPTTDMRLESWLNCHANAYEYFGGVTRLLIPDNLKTGVTKNTRYETILNRSYQELAEYYDTAIVPARVEHPKDKSHAEAAVRMASTWILAALRNQHFFTLNEVKNAVSEKLNELNLRPFTNRQGNRLTAFCEEEQAFMKPLPSVKYELATWNPGVTVGSDYLIFDGKNKYSIPFDLIGEKVDIRLTKNTVEVFFHGNRVASHKRILNIQKNPIVNPKHMTPEHRKYLNYNTESFVQWAQGIGINTEKVIRYFLSAGKEAEQGFKACASLIKLSEKYNKKRIESTCGQVLSITASPSIRLISSILKNSSGSSASAADKNEASVNAYGITRGFAYYSKTGKVGDKE